MSSIPPPQSGQPILVTLTKPGYPPVGKHMPENTRTTENPEEVLYVQVKADNLDSQRFVDTEPPLNKLVSPSLRSPK